MAEPQPGDTGHGHPVDVQLFDHWAHSYGEAGWGAAPAEGVGTPGFGAAAPSWDAVDAQAAGEPTRADEESDGSAAAACAAVLPPCKVATLVSQFSSAMLLCRVALALLVWAVGTCIIGMIFWSRGARFVESRGFGCQVLILSDTSVHSTPVVWLKAPRLYDVHWQASCSDWNALMGSTCSIGMVERCSLVFETSPLSNRAFVISDEGSNGDPVNPGCPVGLWQKTTAALGWGGDPRELATFVDILGGAHRSGAFLCVCMFVWLLLRLFDVFLSWLDVRNYYMAIARAIDTWIEVLSDTGSAQSSWQWVADEFAKHRFEAKQEPWVFDWSEGCVCVRLWSKVLYKTKLFWMTLISYNLLFVVLDMKVGQQNSNLKMWQGENKWVGYSSGGDGPDPVLNDGCPEIIPLHTSTHILWVCVAAYPVALTVGLLLYMCALARYQPEHPCHGCHAYKTCKDSCFPDASDEDSRDSQERHLFDDIEHYVGEAVDALQNIPNEHPPWVGVTAFWCTLVMVGCIVHAMVLWDSMTKSTWDWTLDFWIQWPQVKISMPSKLFVVCKLLVGVTAAADSVNMLYEWVMGRLVRASFMYKPKGLYRLLLKLMVVAGVLPDGVLEAVYPGFTSKYKDYRLGVDGPDRLYYRLKPSADSAANGYVRAPAEVNGLEVEGGGARWVRVDAKGYLPKACLEAVPESDYDCLGLRRVESIGYSRVSSTDSDAGSSGDPADPPGGTPAASPPHDPYAGYSD